MANTQTQIGDALNNLGNTINRINVKVDSGKKAVVDYKIKIIEKLGAIIAQIDELKQIKS